MSRPSRCVRARLVPALRQDWHDDAVDDLSRLRRWEDAGGTWRVERRTSDALTLALCRCDGGEEVDRLTTTDPAVLGHVGVRASSEEPGAGAAD